MASAEEMPAAVPSMGGTAPAAPDSAVGAAKSADDDSEMPPCDTLFRNSKGKVKDPPVMPVSVADTHAHLVMLTDPALSLARCAVHHVDFVETMVDPPEGTVTYDRLGEWREGARRILDAWDTDGYRTADGRSLRDVEVPTVRIGIGVHPHNAKDYTAACERELIERAADPRTSFIGEIGLDYHYDFSPREQQRVVFVRQLELAQRMELPVSLHIREAHGEALELLARTGVPEAGCVLHCFNRDVEALRPWLDLGCSIALGGPLTFKKSHALREAAPEIPMGRLLTETDSPYMTPEPLRGTECGPEDTVFTAHLLWEVYSQSHPGQADEGAFLQAVYDNAKRLFDAEPSAWQSDGQRINVMLAEASGCVS